MTSDVIGRRVTVRHRDGDGARDVIGRVIGVAESISIEQRDGAIVAVEPSAIIVWRIVPDRPARSRPAHRVDAETLARITSRGWPAVESEPLGDWELRASGGFTGRANSALVVGDPGAGIGSAIDHVTDFYRSRGLPPLAQVIVGSPAEQTFLDHGWQPLHGARPGAIVQVADLGKAAIDPEVDVATDLTDDWMSLYPRIEPTQVDAARQVLDGPRTVGFVSIGSPPVAIGRVVVTGEWAGLAAVEVSPGHRRQGLARRIVTTSLAWAAERGADKVYLQTMRDNHAALALYEPFGFTTHHEYRYLTPR